MKITVNGKEKSYDRTGVSVVELLSLEDVEGPEMVTVQVNGKFLNQERYKDTHINEGDRVEFLYFMGGGTRSSARSGECNGARSGMRSGARGNASRRLSNAAPAGRQQREL